jgi:sialate O-acetylesterase
VLYFFGRELHKDLDVPMGLIHTSWGGTPAESWTSRGMLEKHEVLRPILERWDQAMANYPTAKAEYDKAMEQWSKDAEKAKAEGKEEPPKPGEPLSPSHPHRASGLYNAMIAPLVPYGIRGAIWYQGESNAGRAFQYRTLFPAMITDWRENWNQGDFPFYFVQLANFTDVKPEPGPSDWAELREAQTLTLGLKNTGMAVIVDIGEAKDIHPRNKQDVGRRLALLALARDYGKRLVDTSPMYNSMKVKKGKAIIKFDEADGGLVAKGGKLEGFAVAGADQKFVWAEAKIKGKDRVVVSSPEVKEPVAVRYAWAHNPVCNLFNKAGLPASPFRTDDWPGVTVDAR